MKYSKILPLSLFISLLIFTGCSDNPTKSETPEQFIFYGGGNNDEFRSVKITGDGGFIAAGYSNSSESQVGQVYLVKMLNQGGMQWEKHHGTTDTEEGYDVCATLTGDFIAVGRTRSALGAGDYDMFLVKVNSDGSFLDRRFYGGPDAESGYSIDILKDGNFIVAGHTASLGLKDWSGYLLKINSNLDTLWTKIYAPSGCVGAVFFSVAAAFDSGFVAAGNVDWVSSGDDCLLVKFNSNGDTVWSCMFGGSGNDNINCVKQTRDSCYIAAGETWNANNQDVYLVKVDKNGNLLWKKNLQARDTDIGEYVCETPDNGYIICGETKAAGAGEFSDVYLIKTDAGGNVLWQKTYGGKSHDIGYMVQNDPAGGYIIAGVLGSDLGDNDAFVLFVDEEGNSK
jgi:hypothetical protein